MTMNLYTQTPNESALDRTILAYRDDPSPENHVRVMTEQRAHVDAFYRTMTTTYQERTR